MENQTKDQVTIRYEKTEITFASHALISPARDEVLIDFSSGMVPDEQARNILPIQTRLAMSWSTVEKLTQLLNQVLSDRRPSPADGQTQTGEHRAAEHQTAEHQTAEHQVPDAPRAQLPAMSIPSSHA